MTRDTDAALIPAELGDRGEFVVTERMLFELPLHRWDGINDAVNAFIAAHPEYDWVIERDMVTQDTIIKWRLKR